MDFDELSALIRSDQAKCYVRRYFGVDLSTDELPQFTGGRFELLAGGGDQPLAKDEFTPADILAVEFLDVRVPGPVSLNLLDGPLGREATRHLRRLPVDRPLWDGDAERLIAAGGPADRLWHLLKEQTDVGRTIAGKLLAQGL